MKSKGFTLIELLVVIAIIAVLAAILFPVFMKAKQAAQNSHCQSNLNQIGKAMKMYLSDWEDTYPTNRTRSGATISSIIMPTVRLSDPSLTEPSGDPLRFQYGFGWVECIYPYVEKVVEGDAASAWKCPAAKSTAGPNTGKWPGTTYAMNSNLVEMPEGVVKSSGNLMLVREMDRVYDSILKPQSPTPSSSPLPIDPFLTKANTPAGLKYVLHGQGSNILFADGHVKTFGLTYFPTSGQWDTTTNQWFNYVGAVPDTDPRYRSIAITP